MAKSYTTQWSGSKTHPVQVTGDMGHYLMTEAKEIGLGAFNRKDLIAATFKKQKDKGYFAVFYFSPLVNSSVCLSVCLSYLLICCLYVSVSICLSVCGLPVYLFLSVCLPGLTVCSSRLIENYHSTSFSRV